MAGFLTSSEVDFFTTQLQTHFDTFKQIFTVFKEPIKTIVSIQQPGFEGYSDSANVTNFSYTPQTQDFFGLIIYARDYAGVDINELNVTLEDGECLIKVEKDARDFINNGITKKIQINDNSFNLMGFESVRNYLGLKYYYFKLKATQ